MKSDLRTSLISSQQTEERMEMSADHLGVDTISALIVGRGKFFTLPLLSLAEKAGKALHMCALTIATSAILFDVKL
jgi:hypothetical protein